MCLFSVIHRSLPECPLLILANREESFDRPSKAPAIIGPTESPGSAWMGGTDLQAGGTWLGVNQVGLIVAITNRNKSHIPPGVRSRGLLCRDLLSCESTHEAADEFHRQTGRHEFAGFNLLLLDRESVLIVEAADETNIIELEPGRHTIANGCLNDPSDVRVQAANREIREITGDGDIDRWVSQAEAVCRLHTDSPQADICRHGDQYGTVSSTVLALTDNPDDVCYRYSPGRPCQTEFQDYSVLLRELLK